MVQESLKIPPETSCIAPPGYKENLHDFDIPCLPSDLWVNYKYSLGFRAPEGFRLRAGRAALLTGMELVIWECKQRLTYY